MGASCFTLNLFILIFPILSGLVWSLDGIIRCSKKSCQCFIVMSRSPIPNTVEQRCENSFGGVLIPDDYVQARLEGTGEILRWIKLMNLQLNNIQICQTNMADYDEQMITSSELLQECELYSTTQKYAKIQSICTAKCLVSPELTTKYREVSLRSRMVTGFFTNSTNADCGKKDVLCCTWPNGALGTEFLSASYELHAYNKIRVHLHCGHGTLNSGALDGVTVSCDRMGNTTVSLLIPYISSKYEQCRPLSCVYNNSLNGLESHLNQRPTATVVQYGPGADNSKLNDLYSNMDSFTYDSERHRFIARCERKQDSYFITPNGLTEQEIYCTPEFGALIVVVKGPPPSEVTVPTWFAHWNTDQLEDCSVQVSQSEKSSSYTVPGSVREDNLCIFILSHLASNSFVKYDCMNTVRESQPYTPDINTLSAGTITKLRILTHSFWSFTNDSIYKDNPGVLSYEVDIANFSDVLNLQYVDLESLTLKSEEYQPGSLTYVEHPVLCVMNTESEQGEWTLWSEWSPCQHNIQFRYQACSTGDHFCSCDGYQPRQPAVCCEEITRLPYATVEFPTANTVNIFCNEGYQLSDRSRKSNIYQCENRSDWLSHYQPECEKEVYKAVLLDDPATYCPLNYIPEQYVIVEPAENKRRYPIGETISLSCIVGLILNNNRDATFNITCLANQTFTRPPTCHVIPHKLNATQIFINNHVIILNQPASDTLILYHGEIVHLQCESYYEFANGDLNRTFIVNISQPIILDTCYKQRCARAPEPLPHSTIVSGQYAVGHGARVSYKCFDGFEDKTLGLVKKDITCHAPNWMDLPLLDCSRSSCDAPVINIPDGQGEIIPENFTTDFEYYYYGDYFSIICFQGFGIKVDTVFVPTYTYYCTPDGIWSHTGQVFCERVQCQLPNPNDTSNVIYIENNKTEYYAGDSASYKCQPKYVVIGTAFNEDGVLNATEFERFCLDNGLWDVASPPRCYTERLQYGPLAQISEMPGYLNITWVNTDFDITNGANPATYRINLFGYDDKDRLRVNITEKMDGDRTQRTLTAELHVPPGYTYKAIIESNTSRWLDKDHDGKPQVIFSVPTGLPAISDEYTIDDLTPLIVENARHLDTVADTSTVDIEMHDVFSAVNGSVHEFNIIVIEKNEFLTDHYIQGTLEEHLATWANASTYKYWPPYLITDKCQLFTGAGCPDFATGLKLNPNTQRNRHKRVYSAADPVFVGDDPFLSSVGDASDFISGVIVNDENKKDWLSGKPITNHQIRYTVGGQICDKNNLQFYCNGKLKLGSEFCIKLRAYTKEHYRDSKCAALVENSGLVYVQWQKVSTTPFMIALIPFTVFAAIALVFLMRMDFHEEISPFEETKVRTEKLKMRHKLKWKELIFQAYDSALTTENDFNVNLLAVNADLPESTPKPKTPWLLGKIRQKKLAEKPLTPKISYFTRHRRWIQRRLDEANETAQLYDFP